MFLGSIKELWSTIFLCNCIIRDSFPTYNTAHFAELLHGSCKVDKWPEQEQSIKRCSEKRIFYHFHPHWKQWILLFAACLKTKHTTGPLWRCVRPPSCPWPHRSRQHNEHTLKFPRLVCTALSLRFLQNITYSKLFCLYDVNIWFSTIILYIQGQISSTYDIDLWWKRNRTGCRNITDYDQHKHTPLHSAEALL